jgi:hypothetical protein
MDLSFLPDQPEKRLDLSFLPDQPEEKMDLGFLPDQPARTFPSERSPREGLYEREVPTLPLPALKKEFPYITLKSREVGWGDVIPGYDVIKETIQGTRPVSPDVVLEPLGDIAQIYLGGKLLGAAFNSIKGSTWFRMLGNKERGLITQSAEDMIKVRETQIRTAQGEISGRLGKPPIEEDYKTTKDFAIAQKRYHDKSADLLKDYDIISEGDIARRVEGYGKKLAEERMQYEKPTIPPEEVPKVPVVAPKPEGIDLTNLPDQPKLKVPTKKTLREIELDKKIVEQEKKVERLKPTGDILSWVRSKGGIDPDTVSADVKELTQKESGFKGKSSLVRKGGRGLDELAQEWGWERGGEISTDELADAIKDAVQSKRKGIPRKPGVGSTEQEIDRYIRRQEEDRYRNQIYESDPNIAKDETFKILTESFDDEIMGFKEELREDGYSETDISRAIGKVQKDIEIEAKPPDIAAIEKEVRSLLSPKVETPPAKELWQMTWDEARSPEVGGTLGRFQESIKKAYSEGKPIPQGNLEFLTNRELKELKPKPALSPTAKDQFALPGIRQGLEMKGAKEVIPTLDGGSKEGRD